MNFNLPLTKAQQHPLLTKSHSSSSRPSPALIPSLSLHLSLSLLFTNPAPLSPGLSLSVCTYVPGVIMIRGDRADLNVTQVGDSALSISLFLDEIVMDEDDCECIFIEHRQRLRSVTQSLRRVYFPPQLTGGLLWKLVLNHCTPPQDLSRHLQDLNCHKSFHWQREGQPWVLGILHCTVLHHGG